MGVGSGLFIVLVGLAAIFAPFITEYAPNALGPLPLQGASGAHLAGTDQFGRDVFTRAIYGGRISLFIGFGGAIIGSGGALLLALTTTYVGGVVDAVFQRFVDTVLALPNLVLLIVLVQIVGPTPLSILMVLGIRTAIVSSRVIRSAIMGVMVQDYIAGARALGARPLRIMFRHVVPNVMAYTIVSGTLQLGALIIAESALSFLGLGIRPPNPSWGGMMGVDGRAYIIQQPGMLIAPAVLLTLTVISANMCGDWIRDGLDPRLRGKGQQ